MKHKATAGDWVMTYDDEAKYLTMKRVERGKGYSDIRTVKGNFDLSKFHHVPTAGVSNELVAFWLDEFKPCENRDGAYNPFAENISVKDLTAVGNALADIYSEESPSVDSTLECAKVAKDLTKGEE